MLTPDDIEFIKATREEIKANRTDNLSLYTRVLDTVDPYTGEQSYTYLTTVAPAVISGMYDVVGGEKMWVNGVEIKTGDMKATFDKTVDLNNVYKVTKDGVEFTLVNVMPRGLGEDTRYECILRRNPNQ